VADLPCFHFPQNERKVAVANRILREVAAERELTVVPLHATTKRQGFRSVATQFANDLFHPNDRGYRIWADAFLPELTVDVSRRFPALDAAAESAQPDVAGKIPQAAATPTGSVGGAS
jgi:acyl-CoA thioesterase I